MDTFLSAPHPEQEQAPDDVLAKVSGLHALRAKVGTDLDLRAVTVELSAWGGWQLVLAQPHARTLALRILNALDRLDNLPPEEEAQAGYDAGDGEGAR